MLSEDLKIWPLQSLTSPGYNSDLLDGLLEEHQEKPESAERPSLKKGIFRSIGPRNLERPCLSISEGKRVFFQMKQKVCFVFEVGLGQKFSTSQKKAFFLDGGVELNVWQNAWHIV